jgi:hypothetical protein
MPQHDFAEGHLARRCDGENGQIKHPGQKNLP